MAEGAAPVQVLRAALGHLQKLHRARLAMDEQGMTAADADQDGPSAGVLSEGRRVHPRHWGCGRRRRWPRRWRRWPRRNGAASGPAGRTRRWPQRGADLGAAGGGGVTWGATLGR